MMPGMIMLWYGTIETIPSGWALCDGTNGTPDLKGQFIRGAGSGPSGVPGDTGGVASHVHAFTGDGHAHGFVSGLAVENVYPNGEIDHGTGVTAARGDTDSQSHLPPFTQLCYIMKLPIP